MERTYIVGAIYSIPQMTGYLLMSFRRFNCQGRYELEWKIEEEQSQQQQHRYTAKAI
jgi:hypothetical protein